MMSQVTISSPLAKVHIHGSQPNEMDLRRIVRLLENRVRYRYVSVSIVPTECGYRILSPCCSRTIAPAGHLIDIALLEFDATLSTWKLSSKNHAANVWCVRRSSETLLPLMDYLNEDPERSFWQ